MLMDIKGRGPFDLGLESCVGVFQRGEAGGERHFEHKEQHKQKQESIGEQVVSGQLELGEKQEMAPRVLGAVRSAHCPSNCPALLSGVMTLQNSASPWNHPGPCS